MARFRKRRNGKRKAYKKAMNAQLATVGTVKKLIAHNIETKFRDTNTTAAPPGTGQIFSLSEVVQGVTDNNRIGDTIKPTSIQIRIKTIVGDSTFNFVRFILFRWRPEDSAVAPSAAGLIENVGSNDSVVSPYYRDTTNYTIVMDKTFSHVENTSSEAIIFKMNKKLSGSMKFVASATNGFNKLYIAIFSDSSAAPHPDIRLNARLFYKDA